MQLEDFAMACAPKHVRSSSADEHAASLARYLRRHRPIPWSSMRVAASRIEADRRVIVIAGLPVHHYRAEDAVAEAYAMVFLVESGFARQTDVARAFERFGAQLCGATRERYARRRDGERSVGEGRVGVAGAGESPGSRLRSRSRR